MRASLRLISPRNPFASLSRNLYSGRYGALKIRHNVFDVSPRWEMMFGLQRKFLQTFNRSGSKICLGSSLGLSVAAGTMYKQSNVAHAMSDYQQNSGETADVLKREMSRFWTFARRIQLPLLLTLMLLFGWGHPVALAIDVALLLFCTRPNPLSIYLFLEQLRQRDMLSSPSLSKVKMLYLRDVEVHDYKLLCIARVELRHKNLYVIGILGEWFDIGY